MRVSFCASSLSPSAMRGGDLVKPRALCLKRERAQLFDRFAMSILHIQGHAAFLDTPNGKIGIERFRFIFGRARSPSASTDGPAVRPYQIMAAKPHLFYHRCEPLGLYGAADPPERGS